MSLKSYMPQLEILATDGNVQKSTLWLDVTLNGIYAGWFSDKPNHISYHADGNFFLTSGDSTKKVSTFHELKELQGHATSRFCCVLFKYTRDLNQSIAV
jgi:hypothetical protein